MESQQAKGLQWLKNLTRISLERCGNEPMDHYGTSQQTKPIWGKTSQWEIRVTPAPTIHNLHNNTTALLTGASRKQGVK